MPGEFLLLVAGSPHWGDRLALWRALDEILWDSRGAGYSSLTVLHTGEPGAAGQLGTCELASRWVRSMRGRGYSVGERKEPGLSDLLALQPAAFKGFFVTGMRHNALSLLRLIRAEDIYIYPFSVLPHNGQRVKEERKI